MKTQTRTSWGNGGKTTAEEAINFAFHLLQGLSKIREIRGIHEGYKDTRIQDTAHILLNFVVNVLINSKNKCALWRLFLGELPAYQSSTITRLLFVVVLVEFPLSVRLFAGEWGGVSVSVLVSVCQTDLQTPDSVQISFCNNFDGRKQVRKKLIAL